MSWKHIAVMVLLVLCFVTGLYILDKTAEKQSENKDKSTTSASQPFMTIKGDQHGDAHLHCIGGQVWVLAGGMLQPMFGETRILQCEEVAPVVAGAE